MNPRNQLQGNYRIFVGAFPTGELAEALQKTRLHADYKTACITPPHVTVVGTYWRNGPATPENEAPLIERLQALAPTLPPFSLQLGGVKFFPPRAQPVIYLGVNLTAELVTLRQQLVRVMGFDRRRDFVPHLTLAMRLQGERATQTLAALQASTWATGQWVAPIPELWLMQRGHGDAVWRKIMVLPLGEQT